jgi:periodic tryptophan protein 1
MDDEDEEDDEILATDTILAVAMTEDDVSHVEIQVLTSEGSLYTHHDIMLPDFPLSMAWMDCPPYLNENGTQTGLGSYLAVGTFSPAIEIWNLDVLDPIEPSAILGGEDESKSKRKNKQKPAYLPGSHTDAVLSLSWNTTYRQALASGSADTTVKVWDVTTQQCSFTLDHHKDKVQTVLWHPHEAHLLTSASYDKRVCLIDMRNPKYQCATMAMLNSDIESLAYDPFAPHHLYGATEDGRVFVIDLRKFVMNSSQSATLNQKDFLLSFQAHDKTVSSLSFSAGIPGLLATSSLDKTVKVWDTASLQADHSDSPPTCVAYKSMNVGRLFTAKFSGDDPFLYATGGDKGMLAVWEADEMDTIRTHFENRKLPIVSQYLRQEVIEGNETALDRQRRISHEQLSGLVVPAHALSEKMRQDAIIAEFEADQENEKKNKKTNKKKDSGNAVSVSDLSGGDKKQKKKGGNK